MLENQSWLRTVYFFFLTLALFPTSLCRNWTVFCSNWTFFRRVHLRSTQLLKESVFEISWSLRSCFVVELDYASLGSLVFWLTLIRLAPRKCSILFALAPLCSPPSSPYHSLFLPLPSPPPLYPSLELAARVHRQLGRERLNLPSCPGSLAARLREGSIGSLWRSAASESQAAGLQRGNRRAFPPV